MWRLNAPLKNIVVFAAAACCLGGHRPPPSLIADLPPPSSSFASPAHTHARPPLPHPPAHMHCSPKYGATLVTTILGDPALYAQWKASQSHIRG